MWPVLCGMRRVARVLPRGVGSRAVTSALLCNAGTCRADFTLLGDMVNTAARVAALAVRLQSKLLLSSGQRGTEAPATCTSVGFGVGACAFRWDLVLCCLFSPAGLLARQHTLGTSYRIIVLLMCLSRCGGHIRAAGPDPAASAGAHGVPPRARPGPACGVLPAGREDCGDGVPEGVHRGIWCWTMFGQC